MVARGPEPPRKKGKTKKRRTRTAHPGVKLIKRTRRGVVVWIARWREADPSNPGRQRWSEVTLASLGLTNEGQRTDWAKSKSEELLKQKAQLRLGGSRPAPRWKVETAIEDYLARSRDGLRPTTVEGYTRSVELFRAWAQDVKLKWMTEITEPGLGGLRDWLAGRRKKAATKEGTRGAHHETAERVGTVTVNHDMLRIRLFLRDARRLGRLPQLSREQISEALKGRRPPRRIPKFLRPSECQELLQACSRHDSATFVMTRDEKLGDEPGGTTPRYKPAGPAVLFLLLSGCRLKEALALKWQYCHIDGSAPEIILPAALTKTDMDRSVDLGVSPSLTRLLRALQLRREGEYVFGGNAPLSKTWLAATRKRLIRSFSAPEWSPQMLRATCASALCCAPSIYGSAGIFLESRRLGHSVAIAETRYAGTLRDLPRDARTIEAALGIEALADGIVERVACGPSKQQVAAG